MNNRLLEAFIAKSKVSNRQFARDVDCSEATVSRLIKGDRIPSLALAKRIQDITDGFVPMDGWPPRATDNNARIEARSP